jgi:hypothetical protein
MLGQRLDGGPVQACRLGSGDILGAQALGDAQGLGAAPLGLAQRQDVLQDRFDHMRSQKRRRHVGSKKPITLPHG